MVTVRRAAVALCLGALLAVSAATLTTIYADRTLLWLLLGAAAASVGLGALLRCAPAWVVGPISTVALVGYVLLVVRLTAIGPGVLAATVDALRGQIPRLLTAMIPVEAEPDTVALPVIATWVAGMVGAELALRSGRVLAGYAAPTLLYVGVLVVVGPNAAPQASLPLAFVGVAGLGLAAWPRTAAPSPVGEAAPLAAAPGARRPSALVVGALAGVLLIGAGAALAPLLAERVSRQPTDPRKYVERPQLDTLDDNPLIRLSGWAQNPTQPLFDVRLSEQLRAKDKATRRLRLAVLNDYDGITWRVGAEYRAAGRVLPPTPDQPVAAREVGQHITIRELGGRLLPAVDGARRVEGVRVAYDQSSGTLLQADGLREGAVYDVRSERPIPDLNLLSGAEVPAGPSVARFLRIGDATPPPEITDIAEHVKGLAAGPYARASALESFLAEHYTYSADAPSGHAYPNLKFFLGAKREEGGQRGTSEQFAASYAVIARLMGLPSRVVVGFRAPAGSGTVLAGSAFAWPEVYFDGLGWYAFDPLPESGTTPQPPEEAIKPEPEPSKPPEDNPPVEGDTDASAKPSAAPHVLSAPQDAGSSGQLVVGALVVGAVLALLVLVLPVLLRARRRGRRLRRGLPSLRVRGAWLEVLDGLRLAGRRPAAHLPASDVAALAHQPLPDRAERPDRAELPRIDALAALVNRVGFAPVAVSEEDADAAGAIAVAYLQALRGQRSWWRRIAWSLTPRPLFWRPGRGTPRTDQPAPSASVGALPPAPAALPVPAAMAPAPEQQPESVPISGAQGGKPEPRRSSAAVGSYAVRGAIRPPPDT